MVKPRSLKRMLKLKDDTGISIEKIRIFVHWWNSTYPIDYWWRTKHSVPFGSKAHNDQNILDMRIEFEEDRLVEEQSNKALSKKKYRPGTGNWLDKKAETRELSTDQAEDVFEDLDIAKLQEMDVQKLEAGEAPKRGEKKSIEIKTKR